MRVHLRVTITGHPVVEDRDGKAVGVDLRDPVGAQPGERRVLAQMRDGRPDPTVMRRHHLGLDPVVAERPHQ
jgi:hypothetical protein